MWSEMGIGIKCDGHMKLVLDIYIKRSFAYHRSN